MKLIFIHGRSQTDTACELRANCVESFNDACKLAKTTAPDESQIIMPYYADLLSKWTESQGHPPGPDVLERGGALTAETNTGELNFTLEVLLDMAKQNDISKNEIFEEAYPDERDRGPLNWPVALAAIRLLNKIPGLPDTAISELTHDVWCYLTHPGFRAKIDERVGQCIPMDEATVIVGHSLGSVVAYNVLMELKKREHIVLLVTLGSPLGIDAIVDRLPGRPRRAPQGVSRWFNARDRRDIVALHEISPEKFPGEPKVLNYSGVLNESDNRHKIGQYLIDPQVAAEIGAAIWPERKRA
jgi:hypothetical protein